MQTASRVRILCFQAALASILSMPAQASLITNGGFEAGFTAWTTLDQVGSEGGFSLQSGTESPVNLLPVPAPPAGTTAAMTDAMGPGSHVLYQDFVAPALIPSAVIRFSLFISNGAPDFYVPDHLDFGTAVLNQQARVDIMTASADPFSVAPGDVLQNLYLTQPGDPLVAGYGSFQFDITPLLQAHPGETLRLRFAEADNVFTFNLGVDDVDLRVGLIPEPSSWVLSAGALVALGCLRRRRWRSNRSDLSPRRHSLFRA